MSDEHTSTPRRDAIRAMVVQEARGLRRRRRVRRAIGVTSSAVLLAATVALWQARPRPNPDRVDTADSQKPDPASAPEELQGVRVLTTATGMPHSVRIVSGGISVPDLVSVGTARPVTYLGDDELLRVLAEAGQPASLVHAGGITRVVPYSPAPEPSILR